MQGEADETERLRAGIEARRGVTVVGELVELETEEILTRHE